MWEEFVNERLNDIDNDICDIRTVVDRHKKLNENRFRKTDEVITKLISYIDKLQDEVNELQLKVKELESNKGS